MSELPPATLEGWYCLHQMVSIDWKALAQLDKKTRDRLADTTTALLDAICSPSEAGWSAAYQIVGGGADFMFVHFRESLDALGHVELELRSSDTGRLLHTEYDFTSVTEAGLYGATAQAAEAASPGSREFHSALNELAEAERASPHIQARLFPIVPDGFRYVCFYPMSKRRTHHDNWYALPIADRNRMMREHGLSGRRYAGRVSQIITGSIGFDDWEWGVTLYARDPLEFKRIVTELRYDEASARYGEFGEFFTGMKVEPRTLAARLR
jgi:hydrogen peroxide-dependent heme synthase